MDSESGSEDEMEPGYAVGGQFDYEEEEEIQTYTGGEFDEAASQRPWSAAVSDDVG